LPALLILDFSVFVCEQHKAVARGVALIVVDSCVSPVDCLITSCASPSISGLTGGGGVGNCLCNKQCAFGSPL
jgi:hypothetical protein